VTTLARKAWVDLTRHRARTLLTTCTLGLAIASLATVAVPGLMDRAMREEVRAARLHDIAMTTHDVVLGAAERDALARLPNVAAFDARVVYSTRAMLGNRQEHAVVWGLDFGSQPVDSIQVTGGRLPEPGEVLADDENERSADFPVATGDDVAIGDSEGGRSSFRVSGSAHSLATSPTPVGPNTAATFYADIDTTRSLAGMQGFNTVTFRLSDTSAAAEATTIAAVHEYLNTLTGDEPFADLPDSRAEGDWPGRSTFRQISAIFYIITVLALGCAVFLIANTMNTLIAEQSTEVAILKSLGGRRRQIAGIFVRTAALLGAAGALLGAAVGVVIAHLLTRFFTTTIFDVHAGFAVSPPVVAASVVAGPVLAVVASLPALRRALRRPVAETLADRGVTGYGTGRLDRLVARSHLLSSPARMGVRNVLRRKRRSAATIAQVTVAIALALALFAVGRSVTATVDRIYRDLGYDLTVSADEGARPLDDQAGAIAAGTPGIARVEPVLENRVQYQGDNWAAIGLGTDPVYQYRLRAGRWFTATDLSAATPAVVLGPAAARTTHAHVGDTVTLDTAAGPTQVEVIGIDSGQLNNGGVVYFPLPSLQQLTGTDDTTNELWLTTTSPDQSAVDRATTAIEDRLAGAGYQVDTNKLYVEQADNRALNDTLLTVIEVMGLLVVAITLIGLVSTLTMGVIERTREIGVLRSLGARARHIRRVFTAEGIVLATIGWILGVPLGWVLFRALLVFIRHDIGVDISPIFPTASPPVALVATVAVTIIVIRPTLRRAARIEPGAALRYQ
jgi:putative ABC transport system permease protein